ncbi:DNA sulfur modification protein DndB [Crossiella sp. CA-258035]|uniref:DNA sulfur modification protein DndB n=1 Tax=Crossiella sp. CA-258035 TaxID=2981138 RepID=UPI0024BC68B9|nr:DNA sulfur modification protein DndB [Crossiella sp. CA-258035]WHT20178.1 DNA sulfur modification protein DndB [Crossiella sp. CA-258035]
MSTPFIAQKQLISTSDIPEDPAFGGLRIVRIGSDEEARANIENRRYRFQHELEKRHVMRGMLCLKGAEPHYRICVSLHPSLGQFTDIVRYNPSDPPRAVDYEAIGMRAAHEKTQSDFKGAKATNRADFKRYILEAIHGERVAYLPTVTGWQSVEEFEEDPQPIFVVFDEVNSAVLYGEFYLPKRPVMQADGQTQTAALFEAAQSGVALKSGALNTFFVTLEIELKVDVDAAAQSFADRNGRGTKKNANLVATYDTSSALSRLRNSAIKGTIFEGRVADGRSTGATLTAVQNIVDASTLEQMLLNVISHGNRKREHLKHHHIPFVLPYCREFLQMLEHQFGAAWSDTTQPDTYRRLYVHGWAFALKALALAYNQARREKLGPIMEVMLQEKTTDHDTVDDLEKRFSDALVKLESEALTPKVSLEQLKQRLAEIDWRRDRRHWIQITGFLQDKNGTKKTVKLKTTGEQVVAAAASNTPAHISQVENKILSENWRDLTKHESEPIE